MSSKAVWWEKDKTTDQTDVDFKTSVKYKKYEL